MVILIMAKLITGLSPGRELRAQRRMITVITRRYTKEFAAELRRESERLAKGYEATGSVPPKSEEHEERIGRIYASIAKSAVRSFGSRILEQGKAMGLEIERKEGFAELFARLALEWIKAEAIRRRITRVSDETRNRIVRQVASGEKRGLGVSDIASGILKLVPFMSRVRGEMIARTETHGAANYGANQAARATGLEQEKVWISVEDARTRDFGEADGDVDEYNHREMNDQRVDMDQPFQMPSLSGGNISAMYPGDPSLPAGATINCRCAVGYLVKGLDFGD